MHLSLISCIPSGKLFEKKNLVVDTLLKGGDGRRYRDVGNGGPNLVKTLHEGAHEITRLYGVEVGLNTMQE